MQTNNKTTLKQTLNLQELLLCGGGVYIVHPFGEVFTPDIPSHPYPGGHGDCRNHVHI